MEKNNLADRLFQTAASLDLTLDSHLSCLQWMADGTLRVIATVNEFPNDANARSLAQSALHIALMEDFTLAASKVDVAVFMPPAVVDLSHEYLCNKGIPASQQVRVWCNEFSHLDDDAKFCRLLDVSYMCVVNSYPWKQTELMRSCIPNAIQKTLAIASKGNTDHMLPFQQMDVILPLLGSVILSNELPIVSNDIVSALRGVPNSLLEMYEVIYLSVSGNVPVTETTKAVFHRLFWS